jgi:DNA polymerase III alpha subunit
MFLNTHSQYSLRYGTMDIKTLIAEARDKGVRSMVLTDINNSTGCMEFIRLCRKESNDQLNEVGEIIKKGYSIKPIIGIEFRRDKRLLYIGIAKNREGMRELNEFLTHHNLHGIPLPEEPFEFKHAFVIYPYREKISLKENEYLGVRTDQLNKLVGKPIGDWKGKLVIFHPVTFRDNPLEIIFHSGYINI